MSLGTPPIGFLFTNESKRYVAVVPLVVNEAPTMFDVTKLPMAVEFGQPLSLKVPVSDTPELCPVAVYELTPMGASSDGKLTWQDHAPEASATASHDVV